MGPYWTQCGRAGIHTCDFGVMLIVKDEQLHNLYLRSEQEDILDV